MDYLQGKPGADAHILRAAINLGGYCHVIHRQAKIDRQSSLLCAVGTRGAAPYKGVLTHGYVVDGQGKKM
ncbi:MAG: class I tRNA ligase family protein, partial [Anaerolineae bacterium]|nr:class I tRNA ligase family protein [Anaerolineae bacterium]